MGLAIPAELMAEFETKWADQVREEAMYAISVAQKSGADVFHLGEYMRIADPYDWNPDRWPEKFRSADIQVSARTRIDRTGMFE
ncbi:MAG: Ger(x)C family spore germination C-terminal domain-containing protein [Bacillota bacterium]